jgi:hypothetical protein
MSDDLGVHRMWNNDSDFAISLHLHTPLDIVKDGCYTFNEKTGQRKHVKTFVNYSVPGEGGNDVAARAPKCPQ